jgi:HD-GYP domain-containing protein (c-di-GMP phosphodiesterase class II)
MAKVSMELIDSQRPLPVDLYLPFWYGPKDTRMRLVFKRGDWPDPRQLEDAKKMNLSSFFCPEDQHSELLDYVASHTRNLVADETISPDQKCRILYDSALFIIENAFHKNEKLGVNLEKGLEYSDTFSQAIHHNPQVLDGLADMLVIDYDLYTHSVNVCLLAIAFGNFLGLPQSRLQILGVGALYHDIGKRKISPSILTKPGALNDEEWAEMRQHPIYGYEELKDHAILPPEVALLAQRHHENLDGSGYPLGLKDEEIDQFTRILRIVDAYDAITSERCYKNALQPLDAVQLMVVEMKGMICIDHLKHFLRFMASIARRKKEHKGAWNSPQTLLSGDVSK